MSNEASRKIGPKKMEGESREYGENVVVRVYLLRHPEKDYVTGNVKEVALKEFASKILQLKTRGLLFFKIFVMPHKRGLQTGEGLKKISGKYSVKPELLGKATELEPGYLQDLRTYLGYEYDSQDRSYYENVAEPGDEEFESWATDALVTSFYHKNFPGSMVKGEDMANRTGQLITRLRDYTARFRSHTESRIVLISSSGIIEPFIKQVFLQNHTERRPEEVTLSDLGGAVPYGEGVEIKFCRNNGFTRGRLTYKDLDLKT